MRLSKLSPITAVGVIAGLVLVGYGITALTAEKPRAKVTRPSKIKPPIKPHVVASPPGTYPRPKSGDVIAGAKSLSGRGLFTVTNDGMSDVMITLFHPNKKVLASIYVWPDKTASMRNIPPGKYTAYIVTGSWNDASGKFFSNIMEYKLSEPLAFTERRVRGQILFDEHTLKGLDWSNKGNTQTVPLSSDEAAQVPIPDRPK